MIKKLLTTVFKIDSLLAVITLVLISLRQTTLALIPLILVIFLYVYQITFGMTFIKKTQANISLLKVKQRKLFNLSNATGMPAMFSIILIVNSNLLLAQIAVYILLVLILGFSIYGITFLHKNKL